MEIAILGSTGAVGQKALALIEYCKSPFRVVEVTASNDRADMRYVDAVKWCEELPMPSWVENLVLKRADQITAPYALSALPTSVAGEVEKELCGRGHHVCSNASAHRMDPTVPLLIPEINSESLQLLDQQKTSGKMLTNPNCMVAVIALALAPLQKLSPFAHVSITTLQAISGAGLKGLHAMDILGTVAPNIPGEGAKIVQETGKILSPFPFSIQTFRVPIQHGHTASIHIHFTKAVSLDEVRKAFIPWNQTITLVESPQPHKLAPDAQEIQVGQFELSNDGRQLNVVACGHNLVRGAAGAAIANLKALCNYNSRVKLK